MSKSRFAFDKFAKLIEQGLVNYKDISSEIVNILKSKRDEIVFRMKIASKEEIEVLNKRINILEKKINDIKESKNSKKTKRVKKY
tara:strand:- start:290 stop:544 length:255 start_codon:yes stop_codon:yes gene_type:complete